MPHAKPSRTVQHTNPSSVEDQRKKILLVDDHAVVRYAMAALINGEPDLLVCAEEDNGSQALTTISKLSLDLVITDLSLKNSSGLELLRNIRSCFPDLPVLVISCHEEANYAAVAFRAGAMGYLMKKEPIERIITAIRRVLAGQVYLSDALTAKVLQEQVRGKTADGDSPVDALSDRELEIFQLIGRFKRTRDIARELHLSTKTIEAYREQMKRKLNLNGALELVRCASAWVQRESPM